MSKHEKFAVEIKKDHWNKDDTELSMTHNGYQWMTFSGLTPDELRAIADECYKHLGETPQLAALQSALAEARQTIVDIQCDLEEEYQIRRRVYTDDEPLQAALSSALARADAYLEKHR